MTNATDAPEPTLVLTGERTAPGIAEENYWFRRHEVAYAHIVDACRGRRLLEAGFDFGAVGFLREEVLEAGCDGALEPDDTGFVATDGDTSLVIKLDPEWTWTLTGQAINGTGTTEQVRCSFELR